MQVSRFAFAEVRQARWAENFQTVLDTSTALKCVVAFAGDDLFLPRVAEALRILNAQLGGRRALYSGVALLLAWLKERIKKKKEPPTQNEHKDTIVRQNQFRSMMTHMRTRIW